MIQRDSLIFYSGTSNFPLTEATLSILSQRLNALCNITHIYFNSWPDGETGFELERIDAIKGNHVVLFSSPIDDKHELQLRDMVVGCKHQYGAKSVTVVMSFLRYRRQDHPEFHNEITRLRWYLMGLKNQGADNLIVCDPHNPTRTREFAEEFGLRLFIADPSELFAVATRPLIHSFGASNVAWYSPDFGSVGRAIAMARLTGTQVIASAKERRDGVIKTVNDGTLDRRIKEAYGEQAPVITDLDQIAGKHVFMREDELDSGGTSTETAYRLRRIGAASMRLVATHPVCSNAWKRRLFPRKSPHPFDGIYFGNTRKRGGPDQTVYEMGTGGMVTTVDVSPELARCLIQALETLEY